MNIEIKGQFFPQPSANQVGKETPAEKSESATPKPSGVTTHSDQLSLSATAVRARRLQSTLAEQPIVDSDRVAKIKKSIIENTYEIDPVRVSQKFQHFESALNRTI